MRALSRPPAVRVLLSILLLCGLGAAFWALQVNRAWTVFRSDLADLAGLGATGDLTRWPELCAAAAQTGRSFDQLQVVLGPLPALAAPFDPRLAAARPVLAAGDNLSAAAEPLCAVMGELSASFSADSSPTAQLVTRLAAARPQFLAAEIALERAAADLARVPRAGLASADADRLAQAEAMIAELRQALQLAQVAPDLLGAAGPRNYLVVVQNPDELRPTGGFISAGGVVQVEGGVIREFLLRDSTRIDDLDANPYPLAPEAIRRYMLREPFAPALWVFRDANWSPDFPTAAAQMRTLYNLGQPEPIDAVIAITPGAVERVLAATGPLRVEAMSRAVDSGTIVADLRSSYDDAIVQGRPEDRKNFVNRLAAAIFNHIAGADFNTLAAVGRAVIDALDARDIQIDLAGDPAAALLAERGWDGAVRPGDHDFLMVVGANIGYNKVGPQIEQRLEYRVDLRDPGLPRADLDVVQINRSPGAAACVPLERRDPGYGPLMQGCYWNYLRVLTPGGALLSDVVIPQVPDAWMLSGNGDSGRVYRESGPNGSRVFAALTVTPPQVSTTATFRYDLPPQVLERNGNLVHYRLRLQRQPGLLQTAVVQVALPAGAELFAAAPLPQSRDDRHYTFVFTLDADNTLDLHYRVP